MYVLVVGNPIDGITHFGPFATSDEAGAWAEDQFKNDEWWIALMQPVQS